MGIFRFIVKQTYLGLPLSNVFIFSGTGVTAGANVDAIAGHLVQLWDTNLKTLLVNEWELTGVDAQDVGSAGQPVLPVSTANVIGTNVGPTSPNILACKVAFGSPTPRPNRAYKYFGGFSDDAVTDNLINTAVNAGLQGFATGLLNTTVTLGFDAKYAVARIQVGPPYAINVNNLTTFSVRQSVRTQKKRRPAYT